MLLFLLVLLNGERSYSHPQTTETQKEKNKTQLHLQVTTLKNTKQFNKLYTCSFISCFFRQTFHLVLELIALKDLSEETDGAISVYKKSWLPPQASKCVLRPSELHHIIILRPSPVFLFNHTL